MSWGDWQGISIVSVRVSYWLYAERIARPRLQYAATLGSAMDGSSQYPARPTQRLSSSMRMDPGPATLSGRTPLGSATVQFVALTCHSVGAEAALLASAGANVSQSFARSVQPSAEKSTEMCQGTL